MRGSRPVIDPVLSKLAALAPLAAADAMLVRSLSARREQQPSGTELCGEGSAIRPRVLLSGWAARVRMLPDGRRQIFTFLVPGDGIGVCSHPQPVALSSCIALTRVETADAAALHDAVAADPNGALALACARAAGLEEARGLDHVMRLGRQTALERTLHLFLELRWRLAAVGLADDSRFPLPLTQEMLADALGLSIVHVNRTLQQLRRDGMIEMKSGWVELIDRAELAERADYAPPREPRAASPKRSFAAEARA
ncbi:MAG TPA: Crp/Fnr family transcriptional regulator [Caulobacteraceae bacterium]|jgi:CRP-like cAMP-binding protein